MCTENRKFLRLVNVFVLFVYVNLVVILVASEESPCEKARNTQHPRIGFCSGSNSGIKGVVIVIDGFNISNNDSVRTCTCIARPILETATRIDYTDILQQSPLQRDCGSSIILRQNLSLPQVHNCSVSGAMKINVSENIYITLEKEQPSSDTRYCLRVTIDQSNEMNITCNHVTFWNNISESTEYQTTDQSTVDSVKNLDGMRVEEKREDFKTMYIGIGGGVIGMLLLTVIVLCLVKKFRGKKESPRADDGGHEDNNEYGVQYNTLYVSSDNVPNNRTKDADFTANTPDGNVTYQVDGNYAEISLNGVHNDSVGDASAQFLNERSKCDINIDGDYAAIDMDENVASAVKIDLKSSSAENRVEEDRNHVKGDPDIEHVISPGENGCEYAIVQKDRNVDDKNNVYAVVDKTRKMK